MSRPSTRSSSAAGQAGPSLAVRLDARRHDGRDDRAQSCSAAPASTPAACRPRRWSPAPMPRASGAPRRRLRRRLGGRSRVDMERVKARKDEVSRQFAQGRRDWLRGMEHCTVFEGHARFTARSRNRASNGETIERRKDIPQCRRPRDRARHAGHRSSRLPHQQLDDGLDTLPRHLVMVGGSYIGLEFAQMYRRFGSEVTVVERGARLIAARGRGRLGCDRGDSRREGIAVRLNADASASPARTTIVAAAWTARRRARRCSAAHVLLAVGRRPEHRRPRPGASRHRDRRSSGYITVDDQLRTNVPGIWAMGDCNGRGAFTHTSYNDYEIVAANVLDNDPRRVSDRFPCYALYIDPPLGRAGMTEAEVRKIGPQGADRQRPMTRVGRAVEKGETEGFMKVLVDAESRGDPRRVDPRRRAATRRSTASST